MRTPAAGGRAPRPDASDPRELSRWAASVAGDSLTVAAWTVLSRVTGLVRVAVVGAVLGPTYLGNTYQFTNSLPNLLYYGFLAGGLFSSLLAPALVRHIDAGDRRASERVAGGFLGVTLVAMVAVIPLAIILGPLALKTRGPRRDRTRSAPREVRVGRLLILCFIPQMFFYGVVGTATAVMNSRRRFALAAGAPRWRTSAPSPFSCRRPRSTARAGASATCPRRDTAAGARLDRRRRPARGHPVVGGEAGRGGAPATSRLARLRGPGGRAPGAPRAGSGGTGRRSSCWPC